MKYGIAAFYCDFFGRRIGVKLGVNRAVFCPFLRKIGGGCPHRESAAPHQRNETPDALHGQLIRPEADDVPSRQTRFQVFFQIGGEARPAVVTTVHVDAALDLDEGLRFLMGEVGPPFADWMKAELLFQLRPTLRPPQHLKARF